MLVNQSSANVDLTSLPFYALTRVARGSTYALPEGWQSFRIKGETIRPQQEGVVSVEGGKMTLTCARDDAGRISYTLEDNPRYFLCVHNRTDISYTFLNEAGECSIVPAHSFLTVTGKTMVANERIRPVHFFSVSGENNLMFLDPSTIPAGNNVYVSEGTTILTFTAHAGLQTSDVVIESY